MFGVGQRHFFQVKFFKKFMTVITNSAGSGSTRDKSGISMGGDFDICFSPVIDYSVILFSIMDFVKNSCECHACIEKPPIFSKPCLL